MLRLDLDGAVAAPHVERGHGLLAIPERLAGPILERAGRAVFQPQQARMVSTVKRTAIGLKGR
jgi:hypothetical protein